MLAFPDLSCQITLEVEIMKTNHGEIVNDMELEIPDEFDGFCTGPVINNLVDEDIISYCRVDDPRRIAALARRK